MRGDVSRIQECKVKYDKGEVMPLKNCGDAHTVAGVLKLYLASLPEPLLSYRLYDSLLAAWLPQICTNNPNATQLTDYARTVWDRTFPPQKTLLLQNINIMFQLA